MYISIRGVISIIGLLLPWGESQVSLSRTSPPGTSSVCPNATAVFTCRVTGSSTLVWTSPGYIPTTVEFTVHNMRGKIKNETDDVVANLTEISGNILESELRIRASVNSSISCLPDNANSGETVTLTVYNDSPGGVENVLAAQERLSNGDSCNVTAEWDPPTDTRLEDISHYTVRVSRNGTYNETNTTSPRVTLSVGECTNNLSITITTVDRCGREGPRSANIEPELLPAKDPVTTPSGTQSSSTTTTTNTPNDTEGKLSGEVIAALSFIGLIVVVLVVGVILYCFLRPRPKGKPARVGADSYVSTENETDHAASSGPPPPPLYPDGVMLKRRGLRSPRINF